MSNLNWNRSEPFRDEMRTQYNEIRPTVEGLSRAGRAIEILDMTEDFGYGAFGNLQNELQRIAKSDSGPDGVPVLVGELKNILSMMGIQNLSMFKGAISERELAEAMSLAGTLGELRGVLYKILERSMQETINKATAHNERVGTLDKMLGGTGLWTSPTTFGFDADALHQMAYSAGIKVKGTEDALSEDQLRKLEEIMNRRRGIITVPLDDPELQRARMYGARTGDFSNPDGR